MILQSNAHNHDQNELKTLTKHIDSKGRFYYVFPNSGEISYDVPHGIFIPLQQPIKKSDSKCTEHKERINIKSERKHIVDALKNDYVIHCMRRQEEELKKYNIAVENLWSDACDNGKNDGMVVMNWKNLGYASSSLHYFESKYGNPLKSLSLNGNGMDSISTLLGCESALERLSLNSNNLRSLDYSIDKFQSLTYLDLSQNKIESLPETFGQLRSLQILDLSNNRLTYLPTSFVDLRNLKVIYLNCNSLTEFPKDMHQMRVEEIQVMSNQLSTIPKCTFSHLKIFLVSGNKVRFIPTEICVSTQLEVLLLSRNKLKEIPEAFCNLSSLKTLWLNNNQIAALPHGFHRLTRLQDLRLEGNCNMIHPPLHVVSEGVPKVLRWCQLHLARNEYEYKKRIVTCTQEILAEIGRLKLCGMNQDDEPHESVFESDVSLGDDTFYQIVWPTFWSSFIPKMEKIWSESPEDELKSRVRSFPFTRLEVESALVEFEDAGGKVFTTRDNLFFHKCACRDFNGNKKACIPPKEGYSCRRPAALIRMNLIYKSTITERVRQHNEERRINEAVNTTKLLCMKYLQSTEGLEMIYKIAENQVESDPDNKSRTKSDKKMMIEEKIPQLKKDYIQKEVDMKTKELRSVNTNMKKVLNAWMGITVETVFHDWKLAIVEKKRIQEKQLSLERQLLVMKHQECEEKTKVAEEELKLWEKKFDEFNDIFYWQHHITGVILDRCPAIEDLIRGSWTYPELSLRSAGQVYFKSNESSKISEQEYRGGKIEMETLTSVNNILHRRKKHLQNSNH